LRLGTRQLAAADELDTLIDGEASFADQRRQQAAALQKSSSEQKVHLFGVNYIDR
jgi:hypothetical protein